MLAFEHGACGKPQIVPRHSACEELWDGAALLLDPVEPFYLDSNPFLMHRTSSSQLAAHLNALYSDEVTYTRYAQAALQNAEKEFYRWETVADEWHKLFQADAQ